MRLADNTEYGLVEYVVSKELNCGREVLPVIGVALGVLSAVEGVARVGERVPPPAQHYVAAVTAVTCSRCLVVNL